MESYISQMGMPQKQLAERYTEYSGPGAHDQTLYYHYDPAPSPPAHTSYKHHYGGSGHKNNAAMSALTLLAFLFFLHILQSCLKDHMTAMSTPQVVVMTGGREGEENIAKNTQSKIDKSGEVDEQKYVNNEAVSSTNHNEKYLTKITSSEYVTKNSKNKNMFNINDNYSGASDYF